MIEEFAMTSAALDWDDAPAAHEEATAQFVTFRLGPEWYAVGIDAVREVVRVERLTYLPSAPAQIAGAINLRGNIVSVTDPKRLFAMPAGAAGEQSRIVVIESPTAETGLLVDEVGQVVAIAPSQLEPPLATFTPAQAAYIEHVCRCDGRLLAILKGEKLLHPGEN